MMFSNEMSPHQGGRFCTLAPLLRLVVWPKKFKARHIDKYGESNNPKEFI
jgi:hypothetical protein